MCFDILVVHDRKDQRWASEFVGALSYGRNPYSVFRSALIGRRRSVQLVFDDPGDLDPVLLWRRGDSLAIAVGRLNRIEAVEGAGRAPRDAMLPEFDGLDRWLPRRHREVLQAAVSSGAIMLGRLTLPDETPVWDPIAAAHLDERWNADSPLHRAGQAVLAQYEARGINARQAHLHGHDVHDRDTPYFAGFNLRYFRTVPWCLTKHGGVEWIEVTARRFLDVWTERGDDGDIVGMGLTWNRTPHQVRVGGARMWTWCAEDTLIFAIVLNRPVTVESTAPGSAGTVRLQVTPDNITGVSPAGAVITWPAVAAEAVDLSSTSAMWGTFCHHNFFFPSREAAEKWAADRDNIASLSLHDGFAVARELAAALLRYQP